eukprot:gb/GFBE01021512.1/.p1 GENE.gb/GFBE01021512.1/~~gb/GFBE01021512.1/.p1  ORF type:complete len:280 (+),score=36.42 gb/GFBE01021512.1/:1-840(+)
MERQSISETEAAPRASECPFVQAPSASKARRDRRFRHAFRRGAVCALKGAPGLQPAVILPAPRDLSVIDVSTASVQDSMTTPPEEAGNVVQDWEAAGRVNSEEDDSEINGVLSFVAALQQQKQQTNVVTEDWMARLFYGSDWTPALRVHRCEETVGEPKDSLQCPVLSFNTYVDIIKLSAASRRHFATLANLWEPFDLGESRPVPARRPLPPRASRNSGSMPPGIASDRRGAGSFMQALIDKHVSRARDEDQVDETALGKLRAFWVAHPELLPLARNKR